MKKYIMDRDKCLHKKTKYQSKDLLTYEHAWFLKELEKTIKKWYSPGKNIQFRFDISSDCNIDFLTLRIITFNEITTLPIGHLKYFYKLTVSKLILKKPFRFIEELAQKILTKIVVDKKRK